MSKLKRILIITAMMSEADYLIDHYKLRKFDGGPYQYFLSEDEKVELVVTSVGPVNMAAGTMWGILHHNPQTVVLIGVSGAIDQRLKPGSLVLGSSAEFYDHDKDLYKDFAPFRSIFDLDSPELEETMSILDRYNIEYSVGHLVSGNNFVASKAQQEELLYNHKALAVDMECAAFAQVVQSFKLKSVIMRAISDSAGDSGESEYKDNLESSSLKVQKALAKILWG